MQRLPALLAACPAASAPGPLSVPSPGTGMRSGSLSASSPQIQGGRAVTASAERAVPGGSPGVKDLEPHRMASFRSDSTVVPSRAERAERSSELRHRAQSKIFASPANCISMNL